MSIDNRPSYPRLPVSQWWKIRDVFNRSLPTEVTVQWVVSELGGKPESARANIIPHLKLLGLLDQENQTTDLAQRWRLGDQYTLVCREILEAVYPEDLRERFPDADADRTKLRDWFANETRLGATACDQMARLYLTILDANLANQPSTAAKPRKRTQQKTAVKQKAPVSLPSNGQVQEENAVSIPQREPEVSVSELPTESLISSFAPALHIDVQIHIDPSASPEQVDKMFESMSRHLFPANHRS